MKRVRIIVTGTVVQDIGYRLFLYSRSFLRTYDVPDFGRLWAI